MFSFMLGLCVGAVLGAKHRDVTLLYYGKVQPLLRKAKKKLAALFTK